MISSVPRTCTDAQSATARGARWYRFDDIGEPYCTLRVPVLLSESVHSTTAPYIISTAYIVAYIYELHFKTDNENNTLMGLGR